MKTVPTALQAHLDTGATTLCWCWRLTRRDATVLGFTEHDQDLVCDGTTFGAASGFTASQIQQSLGLVIDSLEAAGALSDASISEADILAGRYDDATIELIRVNWSDPTQYLIAFKGSLGQVKRQGAAFTANIILCIMKTIRTEISYGAEKFPLVSCIDTLCSIFHKSK